MLWLEEEKKLAVQEGVSHSLNYPFLLESETPTKHAVLLIHGFSSSPQEMRPLAEVLQTRGLTVYAVRLPGHGTTPDDLARRTAEEWLATCQRGYLNLRETYPLISAVGLSTGALLAIKLALHHSLEKLILLSPFLRLKHSLAPFVSLLSPFIAYQNKLISPEEQPFYYQQRPLKGIVQIARLKRQISSQLVKIQVPTLVLAAEGDETIAAGTALKLFSRLGSREKIFHLYGRDVPHVLTSKNNPEQQDVLNRCRDFLASDKGIAG
ncbi:MAG: alpha/beta fold hydrolase [Desulfuromonadales bacterium]|nr:alpha/beta fold hydrolase [Desulfuromonadales bacterium]